MTLICSTSYVAKIEVSVSLMAEFGFVYLVLTPMGVAMEAAVVEMELEHIYTEKVEFLLDAAMASL